MKRFVRVVRTLVLRKNSVQSRFLVAGFLVVAIAALLAVRWMSWSGEEPRFQDENAEGAGSNVFLIHGFQPAAILNRRLVYPYSVIPGGISSAQELREIAEHDPVVAAHYSGFDYENARIVQVTSPRLVYVSYRRNDKIFWTHRQATLHPGEKLLTDGRTTARTRCGNQVSLLPRLDIAPAEPMIAELERPDVAASGIEHLFPRKLASNLFQIDPAVPVGPGGPPTGSAWPGAFMPLPTGPVLAPGFYGHPPTSSPIPPPNNPPIDNPPPNPPPEPPPLPGAPEPGTIFFMASGAIVLIVRLRSMNKK